MILVNKDVPLSAFIDINGAFARNTETCLRWNYRWNSNLSMIDLISW